MAVVRIVPLEDLKILKKYLTANVVLIPEPVAYELERKGLEVFDGLEFNDYDFGGEPDYYVDLVRDCDHFFVGSPVGMDHSEDDDE